MNFIENNLSKRRNLYRRRRNVIRRLFLTLFVVFLVLFIYKIVLISKKNPPTIEIVGNVLTQATYVINKVSQQVSNKNFFLISSKDISRDLIKTTTLLKNVVVRKYLVPKSKIIVFLKEKIIWAELLLSKAEGKKNSLFVTDEGALVPVDYLNLNCLPKKLMPIYNNTGVVPTKNSLCLLKEVFDILHNDFLVSVSKLVITSTFDLEIYPHESFKIKAGKLDGGLLKRISKLKVVMNAINKRSYLVEYLDLTLDSGAVFKKYSEEKKKFSLFQKNNR